MTNPRQEIESLEGRTAHLWCHFRAVMSDIKTGCVLPDADLCRILGGIERDLIDTAKIAAECRQKLTPQMLDAAE